MSDERAAWLEERRRGLGSSDAASVCDLPCGDDESKPWGTPFETWAVKCHGVETRQTEAMEMGLLMEPVIAEAYQRRTRCQVKKPEKAVLWHPTIPWMCASLDRQLREDNRPLELKNVNEFKRREWGPVGSTMLPLPYLIQVYHQIAVVDAIEEAAGRKPPRCADVAALIGGRELRWYTIERDDDAIANLIKIEADFWRLVERRTPPEPKWSEARTQELLDSLYRVEETEAVMLSDADLADAMRWQEHRELAATHEQQARELRARLLMRMKHAAIGVLPDGRYLERSVVRRRSYTVKASEYITLKLEEPKDEKERRILKLLSSQQS